MAWGNLHRAASFHSDSGQYRLARTAWVNIAGTRPYVDGRGQTIRSWPMPWRRRNPVRPDRPSTDRIGNATDGQHASGSSRCRARTFTRICRTSAAIGADTDFHGRPNEVPDPFPSRTTMRRVPMMREAVTVSFALASSSMCLQTLPHILPRQGQSGHLFWAVSTLR